MTRSALGIVLFALACAGAPKPAPATAHAPAKAKTAGDSDIETGDLAKLDAREIAPLGTHAIAASELTGNVESVAAPRVHPFGEATQIEVPIGARAEVECFVYPHPIDAGGQLLAVMKTVSKAVDVKLVLPTNVVVVGEYAAMFVEATYLAKTAKGAVTGELKLAVYPHPTTPFLCFHDEVGYHKTFERIVAGLARSLARAGAETSHARYVDITVERIGDRPVGFSRYELLDADGGTKVSESIDVSFTPRSPSELTADDSVRTESWEKDGYLGAITYVQGEGGEISEQLVLKRAGAREYTYEGLHLGKKISGKLTTKGPHGFQSDARDCEDMKKLLANGGELRIEGYDPEIDPTAPIETVYRPLSKEARTVTAAFGKLELTATVDSEGRLEKSQKQLGAAMFTSERVFVRGTL